MIHKGQIKAYSEAARSGIIQTEDKRELHFSRKDWLSPDCEPKVGLFVEFQQGPRPTTAVKVLHLPPF
jgi:hypothetical protein